MGLTIKTKSDWNLLGQMKATSVVDPMVIRCGELFLRGSNDAPEKAVNRWELLESNAYAVAMFFDRLVLDDRLPIFNYGDTFDTRLNFDQRVFYKINDYDPDVLLEVDVQWDAYNLVKNAALSEVKGVYDGTAKVSKDEVIRLLNELAVAEYEWAPNVSALNLHDETEKRLAAMLVGGLIFGGYAQTIAGEHVVHPTRSSFLLRLLIGSGRSKPGQDDNPFADLERFSNLRCKELDWMPSFFPYLLDHANQPEDLIKQVAQLRKSTEVRDYRRWLHKVMKDWKSGKVSTETIKDMRAVRQAVDRRLRTSMPKVELKMTVAEIGVPKPEIAVDITDKLQAGFGWILSQIPGNSYRKLLTRAIIADFEYKNICERMKTVWRAA